VAVFGSKDERFGTERIVVLAETREQDPERREQLHARINDLAVSLIGMPVDEIVLASPHTVLKTSSGKIRRAASRDLYERGGRVGAHALWWQVARLAWSAAFPQLRRSLRAAGDSAYGIYVLLLLGALGIPTWIACSLTPSAGWCWRLSRRMARAFLRLAGIRLTVRGLDRVPTGRPCVLAANHSSYLDGVVVVAALPTPMRFVAKRELLDHFVPRIYLRRIGAQFVERFDVQRGVEDAGRMVAEVGAGHSLIFFPEGTFRRMPGLLPFRMGAFVVAARAGMPVVPVTLRGTRSVLRDGQWLFRRGAISVIFGEPVDPSGTEWNAAVTLRDRARDEILRQCAEPDLGDEAALAPQRAP
jgi:1-acyl-sn-glycerol-3-phosphate acyltransferase